jgi:DNA polymerase/3'-5' exonuclease PolX
VFLFFYFLFISFIKMDYKPLILNSLEVLRKKEIAEKQPFKARAYATVIQQLKTHEAPILSFEDVKGLQGIGTKIADKIKEILATGALQAAERAKAAHDIDSLDLFQQIYGVGAVKAGELVKAGLKTIADVRERGLGFLNDKQKVGLHYFEKLLERIPRSEMDVHAEVLKLHIPKELEYEIVGSYRRGQADSGDIDVLLRSRQNLTDKAAGILLKKVVKDMKESGYMVEVLAEGNKKAMGICSTEEGKFRRIDLIVCPNNEYAYGILYFTGSMRFNVAMRAWALDKGYTMNEHGMKPKKDATVPEAPPMNSEENIFAFLGLRYIPPTERVDSKQIISL